jgi:hypothetical protein
MVADAYATIVWLAKTTDSEYHDPKKYEPMADSARYSQRCQGASFILP